MEELSSKKDRRRAIIGSILFHAVLALLFVFYGLKEPHPPKKEKMVSINMDFGTDLKGSGQQESQSQEKEQQTQQQQQEEQQQETESSQKTATQESSPVTAEENEEGEKKGNETNEKSQEQEQEVSDQLKDAQEQFENMEDGGGGEGDDAESGNEGDPRGQPKGEGSLPGAGGSWKLSGRKIVEKPQPEKPTEEGKVVIDIWVDRQGNVTRTSPNLHKSNTTSNKLLKLAEEAAKKAKFNPSHQAAVEQKGTFTFVFEMR